MYEKHAPIEREVYDRIYTQDVSRRRRLVIPWKKRGEKKIVSSVAFPSELRRRRRSVIG